MAASLAIEAVALPRRAGQVEELRAKAIARRSAVDVVNQK
jgi:hypothetical protein